MTNEDAGAGAEVRIPIEVDCYEGRMKDPINTQIEASSNWLAAGKQYIRSSFPGSWDFPDWELVPLSGLEEFPGVSWWPPAPIRLYGGAIALYFLLVSDCRSARDIIVYGRVLNDLSYQSELKKRGDYPAEEVELTGSPSASQVEVFHELAEIHLGIITKDFRSTLDFRIVDSDFSQAVFNYMYRFHSFLKSDPDYVALRQRCLDALKSHYISPSELGGLLSPEYKVSFNFYGWQCFHALVLGDWAHFERIVRDYETYLAERKHGRKLWAEYLAGASSDLFRSFKCWLDAKAARNEEKKKQQAQKSIQLLLTSWLNRAHFGWDLALDLEGRGRVFFQTYRGTFSYHIDPYLVLAMVIRADLGVEPELCEDFARNFGIYFDTFTHLENREKLVSLYEPVPESFLKEREPLIAASFLFIEEKKAAGVLRGAL